MAVEIKRVLREGKMYHGKFFSLVVLKTEEKFKKIGQIVSNKISKSAVDRNFIRRAARFAAGKQLAALPEGIMALFLAKDMAVDQSFKFLVQDAESLLIKAK